MLKGYKAISINLQKEGISITMDFQYFKQIPTEFPTPALIPPHGWGPFCVFEDLGSFWDAYNKYNWIGEHVVLFECEYEPSVEKSIWYTINRGLKPERLLEKQLKDLPRGTVLANSLRLTKLLKS